MSIYYTLKIEKKKKKTIILEDYIKEKTKTNSPKLHLKESIHSYKVTKTQKEFIKIYQFSQLILWKCFQDFLSKTLHLGAHY